MALRLSIRILHWSKIIKPERSLEEDHSPSYKLTQSLWRDNGGSHFKCSGFCLPAELVIEAGDVTELLVSYDQPLTDEDLQALEEHRQLFNE